MTTHDPKRIVEILLAEDDPGDAPLARETLAGSRVLDGIGHVTDRVQREVLTEG